MHSLSKELEDVFWFVFLVLMAAAQALCTLRTC